VIDGSFTFSGNTPITTQRTKKVPKDVYVVCAHVQRVVNVTQQTVSLIHLYHGVYHILAIDIITGLVFMDGWSGMGTLVLLLLTLNPWENRYGLLLCHHHHHHDHYRHHYNILFRTHGKTGMDYYCVIIIIIIINTIISFFEPMGKQVWTIIVSSSLSSSL